MTGPSKLYRKNVAEAIKGEFAYHCLHLDGNRISHVLRSGFDLLLSLSGKQRLEFNLGAPLGKRMLSTPVVLRFYMRINQNTSEEQNMKIVTQKMARFNSICALVLLTWMSESGLEQTRSKDKRWKGYASRILTWSVFLDAGSAFENPAGSCAVIL